MDQPTYEVRQVGGRPLVICTYKGQTGAARVFSSGEDDAKSRALMQAKAKAGE